MEFNEKLQRMRKQKGMTQEELAKKLYVSRTAISKWESGRGYPNIDSLRAIAKCFSVTLDELLSSEELLTLAEEDRRRTRASLSDLVFGILDTLSLLLLFLPLFATRSGEQIIESSLIMLGGVSSYLRVLYFVLTVGTALFGIVTLALQGLTVSIWLRAKAKISLILGALSTFVFTVSLQPYAAVFAFSLLIIKVAILIKRP